MIHARLLLHLQSDLGLLKHEKAQQEEMVDFFCPILYLLTMHVKDTQKEQILRLMESWRIKHISPIHSIL